MLAISTTAAMPDPESESPFWDILCNAADAVSEVRIRKAIERGDSWDEIQRLADEAGWMAIKDHGRLVFISPDHTTA